MDRNKLKLSFLLLAVLLPIGLATGYFHLAESQGGFATRSKGQLIQPVLDIAELQLYDDTGAAAYEPFDDLVAGVDPQDYDPRPWQLLYLGGRTCDEACVERLYFLRQLHIRLAADAERVERVYVQVADTRAPLQDEVAQLLADAHPGMRAVFALDSELRSVLAARLPPGSDAIAGHYIFVMDPVGNVMLYFTPDNGPEDILDDLEKLLDQSSLG